MSSYFPSQDWLTIKVDDTLERHQKGPVRVGGKGVCDVLAIITKIGDHTTLSIEGSDDSEFNYQELASFTSADLGENFVRLNQVSPNLPNYIRWKAVCSSGTETLCFSMQVHVGPSARS